MDHPLYADGEVISVDRASGTRKVYYDIDSEHGAIVTERFLDQQILDQNSVHRSENAGAKFGDTQLVASIPEALAMEQLLPAIKQYDEKALKRWLNNSDNRAFRTFEGNL